MENNCNTPSGAEYYSDEIRLRPYKREFNYSYSCGVFPTCELASQKPEKLKKIVVSEKALGNDGVIKLRELAARLNVPFVVDSKTLERIYTKENVYAAGVFEKYEEKPDRKSPHIVLVNPSDMGNLGNIIRTMVAFRVFDLAVVKPCCDIFDPKTVRASMGAVFRIRPRIYDSFQEYYNEFHEGRSFYPFMLNGAPIEDEKMPETRCFSLIMGNESAGLPAEFLELGSPVRIVHADTVDSLNLTVAAAIGIYKFCGRYAENG